MASSRRFGYRRVMTARILLAVALVALGACVPPPGPMERLGFAAYDLNVATRFGRMDIAAANVAAEAQADFARRHRAWGREIRIVDLELLGMLPREDGAEVELAVTWHRLSEATIHTTTIAQKWVQTGTDWKLVEERPTSGPAGLFPPEPAKKETGTDVARAAVNQGLDLP